MQRIREFKMPDVGEGLSDAEILKWYVAPGDPVHDGMPVCEIETAKAAVELPIPYDGVVHEIRGAEGTTVDIGAVIITVDTAPVAAAPEPAEGAPPEEPADPSPVREPVLVGYGVVSGATRRRPRKHAGRTRPPAPGGRTAAKPPVRKLAKDLGVDLSSVTATGPDGTVTRDDVHAAARPPAAAATPSTTPAPASQTRIPIKGVRKATARAMVESAFTAPHVTVFLTVDVTRTMKLVRRLREDAEFTGVRVTPLLLVAKAFLAAARQYPDINATWDEEAQEIVVKHDVHLGIAAATPRGLVVPNIKNAHTKPLPQLARSLRELVETARAGTTAPADMTGGTLTLTNIGVFGVDAGTPILNPKESAILAVGAVRERPWAHKGRVTLRQVTTLALSFDHRLVDGELGAKVLAATGAVLEHPKRLITWS
ncbi:dihydrolipoamide acetyltransferase family protein [Streptomyces sp. NPDC048527]|uniref:dihydrolipoamide acetyltransferase family protein n=1 Tax=Streptomyces sp. NPDC048527 TaxID=3365568 RepID=UPI003714FAA2